MNKDKSLKKSGTTLVFLICGNSFVGKKTFVENFIKCALKDELNPNNIPMAINKSFYNVYLFDFEINIEEKVLKLPIEFRIINSDERDTELKCNSSFYRGALGAFVVMDDNYKNLQE